MHEETCGGILIDFFNEIKLLGVCRSNLKQSELYLVLSLPNLSMTTCYRVEEYGRHPLEKIQVPSAWLSVKVNGGWKIEEW
jgi:hypothetical protein